MVVFCRHISSRITTRPQIVMIIIKGAQILMIIIKGVGASEEAVSVPLPKYRLGRTGRPTADADTVAERPNCGEPANPWSAVVWLSLPASLPPRLMDLVGKLYSPLIAEVIWDAA
jgi:hypothetical protein